jgi:hypothetical protein
MKRIKQWWNKKKSWDKSLFKDKLCASALVLFLVFIVTCLFITVAKERREDDDICAAFCKDRGEVLTIVQSWNDKCVCNDGTYIPI